MVLCGLWHGAGWNYVLFGVYHGSILVLYRLATPWRKRWLTFTSPAGRRLWQVATVVITFHVVTLGWPIFDGGTIGRTGELWRLLFTNLEPGLAPRWIAHFLFLTAPLFAINAVQLRTGDLEPVQRFPLAARALVYAGLLAAIVLLGEDFGEDFLYFQF
jgi:D-alanyl-lipoteichoic acid acyltransferase DltB (MBOAT superfamily)